MSYILEALKKSQQARELGHVPTLETSAFLVEEEVSRPNLLILLAVFLAALAVAIALYSALRGTPLVDEPIPTLAQEVQTQTASASSSSAVATQSTPGPQSAQPLPKPVVVAVPDARQAPVVPSDLPPPAFEADAPEPIMQAPITAESPLPQPASEPQWSGDPVPAEAPSVEPYERIPPDLIVDIEAFKQEIRQERSGAMAEATPGAQGDDQVAPRDLRLAKKIREGLPKFTMSAHIYDQQPAKRFVLINGLKTREGEESREAITVEQILPDGAILSFDGHRFFQER